MKFLSHLSYAVLAFLLVGCATRSALIHPQQNTIYINPVDDKAIIVVIREKMLKGAIGNWSVSLDGREVSRLSIGNYLIKEVNAGEHSLSNAAWVESPTIFTTKSGQIYYFKYDLSFFGGDSFKQINEEYAREHMRKYIRVRTLF